MTIFKCSKWYKHFLELLSDTLKICKKKKEYKISQLMLVKILVIQHEWFGLRNFLTQRRKQI